MQNMLQFTSLSYDFDNVITESLTTSVLTMRLRFASAALSDPLTRGQFDVICVNLLVLFVDVVFLYYIQDGPKKRGHSTFSQISRKLLKISK